MWSRGNCPTLSWSRNLAASRAEPATVSRQRAQAWYRGGMRIRRLGAYGVLLAVVACGDSAGTGGSAVGGASQAGGGGSGASAGGGEGVGGAGDGGSIVVEPPTCVDAASLPAWRAGMAIGEWKLLASADLTVVTPSVAPGGGYYGRIDAWNGFGGDTVNSRVYLAGAGGHADYAGNEAYVLDLTAAAPQWSLMMQPSPASAYTIDEPYYSDGRPSPTHTYYSAWFIEQRAKFFRFPGGSTWGSGNGNTPHIDSFDPALSAWDSAGTNPDLGPAPSYELPTAKNMLTGDVYQLQADNRLYRWSQETNTASDLGEAEGGSGSFYDLYASASVVDTANNRLIFFTDDANPGSARVFDLATTEWSSEPLLGAEGPLVAGAEQGMAWFDSCAELIVLKPSVAGAVYLVDPTALTATAFATSGEAPPDPLNGVHTLFQYMPKLGGYAYQPTHASKMYFLATQ